MIGASTNIRSRSIRIAHRGSWGFSLMISIYDHRHWGVREKTLTSINTPLCFNSHGSHGHVVAGTNVIGIINHYNRGVRVCVEDMQHRQQHRLSSTPGCAENSQHTTSTTSITGACRGFTPTAHHHHHHHNLSTINTEVCGDAQHTNIFKNAHHRDV